MADQMRDPYEVLEVSKDASDDDIKKAYRKLAKKYHPDLNPGDKVAEKKMQEVNSAYDILSNPEKRQRYDQYGAAGVDPNFGAGGFGGGQGFDFGDIFGDIFGGFGGFGGQQRRTGPQKGEDLRADLRLTFEEAVFGCKKDISLTRDENCPECHGSGARPGTSAETCQKCRGTGQVKTTQRTPFGMFASTSPCPSCRGTGRVIKEPCSSCRGTGTVRKKRTITVNIPGGIDEGQSVCIRGEGGAGEHGGPSGDLYIVVSVRPHEFFKRNGYDIVLDMPITFGQAALGDKVMIPTVNGKVEYSIPEGTQSGSVFRLKGQGITSPNGKKGDMYVKVTVEVPTGLKRKEAAMLKDFEERSGTNYPKHREFLGKIK